MVRGAIEDFCSELVRRVPSYVESILLGRKDVVGRRKLQQDPEQFVNQYFVWPVCEYLRYDYVSEWYHEGHGGSTDLYIRNADAPIFGECKRVNHYKRAIRDLRDYLDHRTANTTLGVATDGISWLLIREPGDQRKNVEVLEFHSFRGAFFDYLVSIDALEPELEGERVLWNSSVGKIAKQPYGRYGKLHRESVEESVELFEDKFSTENLSRYSTDKTHEEPITAFHDQLSGSSEKPTLDDFS